MRAQKEQRDVRERERRRINKGGVLERVGGMEEEKRGRRERKAQGYTRREEKPTDSKMKERRESRWETRENWRREGGCEDERVRERGRGRRDSGVKLSGRK